MNYDNEDFCALINVAEMTEMRYDICEMAEDAMAKVFRYGTPEDCAKAVKHYIGYLHSKAEETHAVKPVKTVQVG